MELGSDRSLGVPEAADEYDCKLSPLLHRLHDGASMNEIRDWLVGEVEGQLRPAGRSCPRGPAGHADQRVVASACDGIIC
jgi:hypothetical protein